jgi:hypothetical protein
MRDIDIPRQWTPAVYAELASRGIANKEDVASIYSGDTEVLKTYSSLYAGSGINSDFFPILQLGAARSRFKNAQGTELAALRIGNWPVFEVLAGIAPPAASHHFLPVLIERYELPFPTAVRKARAIRTSLMGQTGNGSRTEVLLDERLAIEYLKSAGAGCRLDSLGSDGLIVLARMAAKTIPYLRADDSARLWVKPPWMKCTPEEPLIRDFLAFIGAVAERDHRRTLQIGSELLNDKDRLALLQGVGPAIDYVIGGMQLSSYATGDFAQVLRLEDQFSARLAKTFARTFLVEAARGKLRQSSGVPLMPAG